jgi:hypothetical protein
MTTDVACRSSSATSSAWTSWCSPSTSADVPDSTPNPPAMTAMNERFIAVHMM